MKSGPDDPIHQLAHLLREENAALVALDFGRAGALLAAKHAAANELAALLRRAVPGPGQAAELRELAALAEENRRLLNRALRIQRRVLDVIARAARAQASPPAYGNAAPRQATTAPRSLVTRA